MYPQAAFGEIYNPVNFQSNRRTSISLDSDWSDVQTGSNGATSLATTPGGTRRARRGSKKGQTFARIRSVELSTPEINWCCPPSNSPLLW